MKNEVENVRPVAKAESKEKALGFTLRTYPGEEALAPYWDLITKIKSFVYDKKDPKNNEKLKEARKLFLELKKKLFADAKQPLVVPYRAAKVTRLNRSVGSNAYGIDYESKSPTMTWCVFAHNLSDIFNFDWHVAGADRASGTKAIECMLIGVLYRILDRGLRVVKGCVSWLYGGFAASAAHMKKDKLILCESRAMKDQEKIMWFGWTAKEFFSRTVCTGADIWKARANLIRPYVEVFQTADGKPISLKDVLLVADVEKVFHAANARTIGGKDHYKDGPADVSKVLGDGEFISLVPLLKEAQGTGFGFKGLFVDGSSSVEYLCNALGMSIDEFMDIIVKDIDGIDRRVGDYKLIAGDGVWKFGKMGYGSFAEFIDNVDKLAVEYPGIDSLYVLRQTDEVEGEERARHLNRTFLQQFIEMTAEDERKLTLRARKALKKQKTLRGSLQYLAETAKQEADRSAVGQLFYNAPWLALNGFVQDHLETRFEKRQAEAISGHIRTDGSYPYIAEDPVALLQIWVLGYDPNSKHLGVLRGDEASVPGLPDGKEFTMVRFPANYQTAKIMKNNPWQDAFSSIKSVMVLSVHSDILITQDGDCDGDKAGAYTNKTVIKLVRKMHEEYNPPVIVFPHGAKAKKVPMNTRNAFISETATALWRAKRYDSVGRYANLATKCAYLASIARANGDGKTMEEALLWMSAASTGAILSIDQVKGNAVDSDLINWLDYCISPAVSKAMQYRMPFIFRYAKNMPAERCLPLDERNLNDSIANLILTDTGSFDFDPQGFVWDNAEAERCLTNHRVQTTSVRCAPVQGSFLLNLADNWFNEKNEKDAALFEEIKKGAPVSQAELLLMLWRNACALSFRMTGETLKDQRKQYYATCRDMMFDHADSAEWIRTADGHVFTKEEKHASVVNAAVRFGLGLRRCSEQKELEGKTKKETQDNLGSFAMFILRVFAEDLLENVKLNEPDGSKFNFNFDDLDFDNLGSEDDLTEEELYEAPLPNLPVVKEIPDEEITSYDDNMPQEAWVPLDNGTMWLTDNDDQYYM